MSHCAPIVLAAISRGGLWYLADLPYPLFARNLEDALVFSDPDRVLSLRRRYLGLYAVSRGISPAQAIAARTGLACVRQLSHLDYQPSAEKSKTDVAKAAVIAKRLHKINVDVIKRATMASAPKTAPRRAAAWVKVWSSERDESILFVQKEDARKHFGPSTEILWRKLFRKGQVPEGQVPEGQVPEGQVPEGQVPEGQVPPEAGNKEWRNL